LNEILFREWSRDDLPIVAGRVSRPVPRHFEKIICFHEEWLKQADR
jgi:hypothetical protein